ncbi:hypothetical protein [Crateriforma conspicua]|uniref:hypothetical protein n=1 Tax=Crateriforma conspicua TaxID=2527996 RepID=UPI001188B21A|nr:hypothetical protein [Crateriforma conspicua]QDV62892.1 hypothetical protein Mal65_20290 [Crateriforma conspicua]
MPAFRLDRYITPSIRHGLRHVVTWILVCAFGFTATAQETWTLPSPNDIKSDAANPDAPLWSSPEVVPPGSETVFGDETVIGSQWSVSDPADGVQESSVFQGPATDLAIESGTAEIIGPVFDGQTPVFDEHSPLFDVPGNVVYPQSPTTSVIMQGRRPWLNLDTDFSDPLLDFQNRQTDKEQMILRHACHRDAFTPAVYVGGQARLSFLAATTNTTDKFPYLGRFPTDFSGDSATDARLLQANGHVTAHVSPMAHVYGEWLFSDVFTFPDHRQGSLQVRQAYAVFGDFRQSPWYLYLGKKNIGFGDLGTLSPFTQSVVWHYFSALAEGVGLGYFDDRWHVTLAAINGGRGIRVADSTSRGKLNNFAANVRFRHGDIELGRIQLGSGFLLGTIYDGFTAEHLDANQFGDDNNSAWNLFGQFEFMAVTLAGEWVSTTEAWPVTGSMVQAYRLEAAYWPHRGPGFSVWSFSYSDGDQGGPGTEFEFNRQLVLGYQKQLSHHMRVSAEYVRSTGFAPLINITTVSDRDVTQDSLVLGATIVL